MVNIRSATPDDANALFYAMDAVYAERIWKHRLRQPGDVDAVARRVTSPDVIFLLAERDGQLAGWLDISRYPAELTRHAAGLGIGVVQSFRGQGVGRVLLAAGIAEAKARGLERIELQVRASNTAATHLYHRFGFVHEGRHVRAIRDGETVDDLLTMALVFE